MNLSSVVIAPIADRLARVDAAAAAASRLVHNRRLRCGWQFGVAGLDFEPMAHRPVFAVYCLSLETLDGTVEAYLSAPAFPSLAVAAPGVMAITPALQQLAAEALLQPLVEALEAIGMRGVRVAAFVSMRDRHEELPSAGWVSLHREGRAIAGFIFTRLPQSVCLQLQIRLAPARFFSRLAPVLAMPGRVTLSSRDLRRSLLATLCPGDVLLLNSGLEEVSAVCSVAFGARAGRRWRADAAVDDSFLTIQGAGKMIDEDDALAHEGDERGEAAGVSLPSDLDVPVRFEIDTVALPLSEIEAMAQGYVIELAAPLSSAVVKLVSCGRVIGTAELVSVGDRLGARITHMNTHNAVRRSA